MMGNTEVAFSGLVPTNPLVLSEFGASILGTLGDDERRLRIFPPENGRKRPPTAARLYAFPPQATWSWGKTSPPREQDYPGPDFGGSPFFHSICPDEADGTLAKSPGNADEKRVRSERLPVTQEAAGSSPVAPAIRLVRVHIYTLI